MLTEKDFKIIEKQAAELYGNLELEIIEEISKRIASVGYANTVVYNDVAILQEMGILYEDIIDIVAKYNEMSAPEIRTIFEKAGIKSLKRDDTIYKMAGLNPKGLNPSMQQLLGATARKTQNNLSNLTMTTANTSQMQFLNAMNKAYMEVSTGTKSYSQAITDTIKDVSKQGAKVQYPSGATRSIESAVRTNILTSVNQTSGKLQEMRAEEMGWDLVEVSAHGGARPEHADWQGKVYSLRGETKGYKTLEEGCDYGEVTGLMGANCRHTFFPYYKGSTRTYTNQELYDLKNEKVEYNGQQISVYDATQIQRKMERQIRNDKKDIAGLQGILQSNNETIDVASVKNELTDVQLRLKQHNDNLNDLVSQTELKKDNARTFIGNQMTKVNKDDIIVKEVKRITGRQNAKIELVYDIPDNIEKYSFDSVHINEERNHSVSKEEAIQYIENSRIKMTVWQGRYENYYSDEGATYVDTKTKTIRTAFKNLEYDEKVKKIMEVLNGRT